MLPVGIVTVDDYRQFADAAAKLTERGVKREKHAVALFSIVQLQESHPSFVVFVREPVQEPGPVKEGLEHLARGVPSERPRSSIESAVEALLLVADPRGADEAVYEL